MQKWEINGDIKWLCRECARRNVEIFLVFPCKWVGEFENQALVCDCCRCNDRLVRRLKGLRWVVYALSFLWPRQVPTALRAMRRAK